MTYLMDVVARLVETLEAPAAAQAGSVAPTSLCVSYLGERMLTGTTEATYTPGERIPARVGFVAWILLAVLRLVEVGLLRVKLHVQRLFLRFLCRRHGALHA
jgi:hypothetical protein